MIHGTLHMIVHRYTHGSAVTLGQEVASNDTPLRHATMTYRQVGHQRAPDAALRAFAFRSRNGVARAHLSLRGALEGV